MTIQQRTAWNNSMEGIKDCMLWINQAGRIMNAPCWFQLPPDLRLQFIDELRELAAEWKSSRQSIFPWRDSSGVSAPAA